MTDPFDDKKAQAAAWFRSLRDQIFSAFEADQGQHLGHAPCALGFGQVLNAKAHIAPDIHVGEERVVLEHHADAALLGRHRVTRLADHAL
mgnify:CR=1 FL=1